ncbi:unnamed protein product [Fusarium equiseti]|uniref:DUF7908 domain-containing protein n=1 Tax=Fusarium equiseti TaxID=61235 RepID=A0A8J2ISI8_FUSEQ|nr:unnamed protein product [Fusarium equiseti]
MASKSLISLLLSSFITSSFAFQDSKDLPETYCVTYLSTYLVPISDATTGHSSEESSVILSPIVDDFLSTTLDTIIAVPTDDPFSTSLDGGDIVVTTSVPQDTDTLNPEPTADPTAPAPAPGGRSIIFRIVPNSDDTKRIKRGILERDLGGVVGSQSDLCSEAIVFSLSQGRLFADESPIYYNGESYKELGGQTGPAPDNAITTTFVDDGGYIQFVNTDLPNGRAGFCQVASSGQVYITFGFAPPNCVPVRLAAVGVEECVDGASTSATDTTSIRTRITSIVQDLTESSGAPIATSLDPILTDPATIDIPVTEDLPETRPFPTTSVRFSNTSTTSIRLPVAPTFSSVLSFVTIDSSVEVPNLPTSLSEVDPIDIPSTQTTFPSEETPTSRVAAEPEDTTGSSGIDIIDDPTATTDVSSTLETDDAFVSETSTAESEPPTTIISVFPVTNSDIETATTTETSEGSGTDTITTGTTTAEITTAPDTTTADTTSADPTTTAEPEPPVFQRACPLAINGVDLFAGADYVNDESRPIDVPFDVGLFGEYARKIYVSDNGQVTINSDYGAWEHINTPLPAQQIAPLTIFTYWDDMEINRALGHQVTYELIDDPHTGKILKVDWCVGTFSQTEGYNHWTLSLFERSPGLVMVNYDSIVKKGESATVGVQNRNKGFFRQWSHNTGFSITDHTVMEFQTNDDGRTSIVLYGY